MKLFISIKNQIFIKSLIKIEEMEKVNMLDIIKYLVKIFVIYNYNFYRLLNLFII